MPHWHFQALTLWFKLIFEQLGLFQLFGKFLDLVFAVFLVTLKHSNFPIWFVKIVQDKLFLIGKIIKLLEDDGPFPFMILNTLLQLMNPRLEDLHSRGDSIIVPILTAGPLMFVLGLFIFLPSLEHYYFLLSPLDGRRQYFLNRFWRIIPTILLGMRVFVRWG